MSSTKINNLHKGGGREENEGTWSVERELVVSNSESTSVWEGFLWHNNDVDAASSLTSDDGEAVCYLFLDGGIDKSGQPLMPDLSSLLPC